MHRLFLITLLTLPAAAQARLTPVPAPRIKLLQQRLDEKLLPPGSAQLSVDRPQVFTLTAPAAPPLTIVPVTFNSPGGMANIYSCGVFLLPASGPATFLKTYSLTPDSMGECGKTAALGLMSDPGPHPRLILILNAYFPPRHSWQQPVVLTWDPQAATYRVDPTIPDSSGDMPPSVTIPQVRGQLAKPGAP